MRVALYNEDDTGERRILDDCARREVIHAETATGHSVFTLCPTKEKVNILQKRFDDNQVQSEEFVPHHQYRIKGRSLKENETW